MDFQSAMETFAEAWVAANSKGCPLGDLSVQREALALTRCKSPEPGESPSDKNVNFTIVHNAPPNEGINLNIPSQPPQPPQTPATPHTPHTPIAPHTPAHTPHDPLGGIGASPSKDGMEKVGTGKSLPVHCIVEAISTLEEKQSNQWRRRPIVETDSFVIIPINTPFHELVHAALHRLGYPSESAAAARGSLVMKNWKALSFDQITDDPHITVGDILGELTTVATLKIQMYRARPSAMLDVKDKLLKLLLVQSQGRLMSTGCPLDEVTISQICRGDSVHSVELSEENRRKFDAWWTTQLNTQHVHSALYSMAQAQAQAQAQAHQMKLDRPPSLDVHPAMQTVHSQYPTQKTRMRTSFDPELELPRLQGWFNDNQHPSRQQIQQYVKELNSLESRRGRKPLDVNNVVYWFKNARAAQKRAEVRNMSPGIPCHLSVNGYNSSSHSPPNGSGLLLGSDRYGQMKSPTGYERSSHMMSEDMSMADSDLEDEEHDNQHRNEDEQPGSPNAPLSLTTNRREDVNGSTPSETSPAEQQTLLEPKVEPSDEPVNLHSPSDLSNNNKMKPHMSDEEDDIQDKEQDSNKHEEPSHDRTHHLSPTSDQENSLIPRGPHHDNLDRLAGFPIVPNSMFSHSIMYMSHYIPGLTHGHGNMANTPPPSSSGLTMSSLAASAADERRKRNRTFIDPVTEVPRLEQWFSLNTHPSHSLILKYTEELNCMTYRQKFPRLEPKNVQFWFKNRRAKCKRLKMSLFDSQTSQGGYHQDRE